jgi:hypothetical protein
MYAHCLGSRYIAPLPLYLNQARNLCRRCQSLNFKQQRLDAPALSNSRAATRRVWRPDDRRCGGARCRAATIIPRAAEPRIFPDERFAKTPGKLPITRARPRESTGKIRPHEGEGILLIFDNAADADALKPYLPRGGAARVLVTSNAPAWRGVAEPVEIQLWPKEIGADYFIARTGREAEREAAEDLSEALGGLPLAHEQAAAYCERLEIPLAEYHRRFAAAPGQMLDSVRDAPTEYHDKLTPQQPRRSARGPG